MNPDIMSHPIQLQRLGLVMEPVPGNPMEAEGVLNPASARGRDGTPYLFPPLVARVRFNESGDPVGVEWRGWTCRNICRITDYHPGGRRSRHRTFRRSPQRKRHGTRWPARHLLAQEMLRMALKSYIMLTAVSVVPLAVLELIKVLSTMRLASS